MYTIDSENEYTCKYEDELFWIAMSKRPENVSSRTFVIYLLMIFIIILVAIGISAIEPNGF